MGPLRSLFFLKWVDRSCSKVNLFEFIVTSFVSGRVPVYYGSTGESKGHSWSAHEPLRPSLSIYHVHSMNSANLRRVILQQASRSMQHKQNKAVVPKLFDATDPYRHEKN